MAVFDRDTSTGALTADGCIDDDESGDDGCGQITNGLNFANSVVVSPNGEWVYAAGQDDAAIVRFDRDTATSALDPVDCIVDNDSPPETCANSTMGWTKFGRLP